jgi:hypothetical protein
MAVEVAQPVRINRSAGSKNSKVAVAVYSSALLLRSMSVVVAWVPAKLPSALKAKNLLTAV